MPLPYSVGGSPDRGAAVRRHVWRRRSAWRCGKWWRPTTMRPRPNMGARLAAQTGVRVSRPGLCVTLKRLGLPRKKRPFGRASRRAPMSPPSAPPLPNGSRASPPRTSSLSTRPGSAPSCEGPPQPRFTNLAQKTGSPPSICPLRLKARKLTRTGAGSYPCRKRRSASRLSCSACLVTRAFVAR